MADTLKRNTIWLLWLVLGIGFWLFIVFFTDIRSTLDVLAHGQWQFILLALVVQGSSYLAYAAVYQSVFSLVGLELSTLRFFGLYLQSLFTAVIIPGGNIAFFLAYAKRAKKSIATTSIALLFVRIADLCAAWVMFMIGLFYFISTRQLQALEITCAIVLTALMVVLLVGFNISLQRPEWLERVLHGYKVVVNSLSQRLRKKQALEENWSNTVAHELRLGSQALIENKKSFARTLALTFSTHVFDLLTVFILFLASHQTISLGALLSGFVVGMFFTIVPITPQGIGTIEGAMILTFSHLGVPVGIATIVTLAFRGLSFWLPAVMGFLLLEERTIRRSIAARV